jgi:hypothetical protein
MLTKEELELQVFTADTGGEVDGLVDYLKDMGFDRFSVGLELGSMHIHNSWGHCQIQYDPLGRRWTYKMSDPRIDHITVASYLPEGKYYYGPEWSGTLEELNTTGLPITPDSPVPTVPQPMEEEDIPAPEPIIDNRKCTCSSLLFGHANGCEYYVPTQADQLSFPSGDTGKFTMHAGMLHYTPSQETLYESDSLSGHPFESTLRQLGYKSNEEIIRDLDLCLIGDSRRQSESQGEFEPDLYHTRLQRQDDKDQG